MILIEGAYNKAQVYIDEIDDNARAQILALCNFEPFADSCIRVMPDVHAGAGCVIGLTMTLHGRAVPNMVGVDIGCGMETIRLRQKRINLPELDSAIKKAIPCGYEIREQAHRFADEIDLSALRCASSVGVDRGYLSIGTLGGGNHFIEIDKDEEGTLYLVIHSGSRHLGLEVAKYYQDQAWKSAQNARRTSLMEMVHRYHEQGQKKEWQDALAALESCRDSDIGFPYEMAYVQGALYEDYIHDMGIVQRFADLNRQAMATDILRAAGLQEESSFTTRHNYIDTARGILRKGAVSASAGEKLLIPINMKDGSLLCTGLGNRDWNQSAPHGAGRLYSRMETKNRFTVHDFQSQMEAAGIYTTTACAETLDECPMAYKSMDTILACVAPTVRVDRILRPLYNFKAAEPEAPWRKKKKDHKEKEGNKDRNKNKNKRRK